MISSALRSPMGLAAALAFFAWLGPSLAWPCGLCHEDDRSAVYSYQAIQKVKAEPQRLEFAVFKIQGPLSQAKADSLVQWLSAHKGVDASTIKVSVSQKSMGFVWEKALPKAELIAELGLSFPELKVAPLAYDTPA